MAVRWQRAGSKVREVLWLRKGGEVPKVCAGYGQVLTAGRNASTKSIHLPPLAVLTSQPAAVADRSLPPKGYYNKYES